ncbi:MAG: ABC transporter ATP-binding protein/permease [Saccharofermentans sp.]|nr:ABC transporter ATP-binding protein/permease [Saccharofermentans sp.]
MNIDLIKKFLGYSKGSKLSVAMSFVSGILYSVCAMAIPYFAGKAIDSIGVEGGYRLLINNLLIILVLIILSSLFQLFLMRVNNKISYELVMQLRNDCYRKIGRLKVSYLDMAPQGKVQSMIISDTETIADGFLLFLNQFIAGIISILVTLVIMFYINWKIAAFVLVFTPLSFIVSYLIAKGAFKSFRKQTEQRSTQTGFISEMASNHRECRLLDVNKVKLDDFDGINETYRKIATKATFLSSISNPSTRFVNALIYAGVVLWGAFLGIGGVITIGALSSLLAYANRFMKPFNDLSAVYTELSDSFACLARIFEFLDEDEIPKEDFEYTDTIDKCSKVDIEFKDVCFSYVPGNPVLKNVSFKIGAGESYAIVGPTGCGKTTLINLLMRYYEPDSGDILVGGKSIKEIPRSKLREYIGFVTQDAWLYNGSVMDNIKFSNEDMNDEDAISASRRSGSHSFIRKLPGGYNEKVDNARDDISAGQKQLLTITRAMASDPAIMVLDEATSSVDVVTEFKIQQAVKELLDGRTGIIIAHRLSTITGCDKIVVLINGEVKELGNHETLVGQGGFYSELYASYIS